MSYKAIVDDIGLFVAIKANQELSPQQGRHESMTLGDACEQRLVLGHNGGLG